MTPMLQKAIAEKQIAFADHSKETKMIIVSDGDIIKNDVQYSSRKPFPLGYDKYTNQTFGNKTFIMNCMNYLCDDSGLISVRSRELTMRLLDKKKIKTEKLKWEIINTLLPLLVIVIFGMIYFFVRKKRYAS
jgi:ABC-2 type transport system permease protein